jgi:hypothetical protein
MLQHAWLDLLMVYVKCIYCMYLQGIGCITFLLNEVYELGEPRSGRSRVRSGNLFVELRS